MFLPAVHLIPLCWLLSPMLIVAPTLPPAVHLIPLCHSALVDKLEDVEPVYLEMEVQNTHR